MKRLLLASNSTQHGSGYLEWCADEVRDLFEDCKTILFVPYALADHEGYAAVAQQAFKQWDIELFSAHESAQPTELLGQADGVFVGGGNTFRLLKALYETGLVNAISERADDGMPYFGTSAGANVACASIRTTNDMPIVYPPSFDAMSLVPFNINPHYVEADPHSKHMGETRDTRLREFHEENDPPVVGLCEGAALRRDGDQISLRGVTKARLFRRNRKAVDYEPGADLSFLLD